MLANSKILSFGVVTMLILLNGCTGCSKSGRNQIRESLNERQVLSDNRPAYDTTPNESQSFTPEAPSLHDLYDDNKKGVFLVLAYSDNSDQISQGTGFFIDHNIGVSNFHVFEGHTSFRIRTFDGRQYRGVRKIRYDQNMDYIVFETEEIQSSVTILKNASSESQIGDKVFTIGNPRGLEQTLSEGIVSGYRESKKYIQTTTEITNGSSGGPLFNMKGKVIGITTSGYGEANLNFAINISEVNYGVYKIE
jgi:serine protease Do